MGISAKLSYSKGTIEDMISSFNVSKPCLFWTGISAFNTEEQKKYEQKLVNAKQFSRQDRLDQDLEKIKFHHEHKQRGDHFIATLDALKLLKIDLAKHDYALKKLVFCETSYLHRHNHLLIDETKGLDIKEAGEKAISYFGQSWKNEAEHSIRTTLDNQHPYQIEPWKEWVTTELATRYIQKSKDKYDNNPNFKAVVDKAAADKIKLHKLDDKAFQNGVNYILEEAAKVWGLKEEFANFNLIVAYPGDLPPAVQYLVTEERLKFAYLKIEFSSTLFPEKQNTINNHKAQQANLTQPQFVNNRGNHEVGALSMEELSNAINNLLLTESSKRELWVHVAKEVLQNSASPEAVLANASALFRQIPTTAPDSTLTNKLRKAILPLLTSQDNANDQNANDQEESLIKVVRTNRNGKRSLRNSIYNIFNRQSSSSSEEWGSVSSAKQSP